MAAGRQRHAHDGIARLDQGHHDALVGLGSRVRLDVDVGAAEEFLGPLDGQALGDVHMVAAGIVAPPGIAFGVLVGEAGADRLHHRRRDVVLRRYQLNGRRLPISLARNYLGDGALHCAAQRACGLIVFYSV